MGGKIQGRANKIPTDFFGTYAGGYLKGIPVYMGIGFLAVCFKGMGALVNKNWTLKLYFFAYNLQLLYGRICFPVLSGCQISQCVRRPFLVEKFYICFHLFRYIFAL